MKIKKLISLFLFLVLSIQVLPLQQIASWLFSNPVAEELAHSVDPVKAKSGTDEAHPLFSHQPYHSDIHTKLLFSAGNYHRDEALYNRHADDILTPPPNC